MKKIYIVAIVMVAVAIGLLTTAADDMSTYATCTEAVDTGDRVNTSHHRSSHCLLSLSGLQKYPYIMKASCHRQWTE